MKGLVVLGWVGLGWVVSGLLFFCLGGGFIGLGWLRVVQVWDGEMLLDTPAVQLNLHAASYNNGLGGV